MLWLRCACVALLVTACDPGSSDGDGGVLDAADTGACDCDDGLFCNGEERCDDGACMPGTAPCADECDEEAGACGACANPDADGDSHDSLACGGDDCDDADPNRFPGNTEICDQHDEDCDPATLGPDGDGDGFTSDICCNGDVCGRDCDDTRDAISPTGSDGCGGGDEDCDGRVDEEPSIEFYLDQDGDSFGAGEPVLGCSAPSPSYAARGGDCQDDVTVPGAAQIFPNAIEQCNQADDDCDARTDEGLSCSCDTPGQEQACGVMEGVCQLGVETCIDGTFQGCTATVPGIESCNALDDDCDGSTDEGTTVQCYPDTDGDGDGDSSAAAVVRCVCDTGFSSNNDDCDDGNGNINNNPGTEEQCNGVDDDCNGADDDNPSFTCDYQSPNQPCSISCNVLFSVDGSRDCNNSCELEGCVAASGNELLRGLCDGRHDDCDGVIDNGCFAWDVQAVRRYEQYRYPCNGCASGVPIQVYRASASGTPPASGPPRVAGSTYWVETGSPFYLYETDVGGGLSPITVCRRTSSPRTWVLSSIDASTPADRCPSSHDWVETLGYGFETGSTLLIHGLTTWNDPHPLFVLVDSSQDDMIFTASRSEYASLVSSGSWENPATGGGGRFGGLNIFCDDLFDGLDGPGGSSPCVVAGVYSASPGGSIP